MSKGSGGTRSSSSRSPKGLSQTNQPQTFEQQVDSALGGLKTEFFDRMEDFYDGQWEEFQPAFEEWRKRNEYIQEAWPSAKGQNDRAEEFYSHGPNVSAMSIHTRTGNELHDTYSNLTNGGYYVEGAKAPNYWSVVRGETKVGDAAKAVKATAQRTAEKKFTEVRAKMLKTTVEKGIDLKNARVESVSGDGFYITDGKIALHARYIMAWGEIKAPHFRFIITDRKS